MDLTTRLLEIAQNYLTNDLDPMTIAEMQESGTLPDVDPEVIEEAIKQLDLVKLHQSTLLPEGTETRVEPLADSIRAIAEHCFRSVDIDNPVETATLKINIRLELEDNGEFIECDAQTDITKFFKED
ncbi:hypothetical protein CMUST_15875 (plasmid) [Corynebacterium mustelae]|uniref:Uncharacterized protein n=1 Tax=Corynebacterium mustelae TaxID=571915 RepID=A0A0G3H6J1_9CORY|nr:hypothetical protein [Corynebacterium mustelae]AKK05211.1 hypothetical protein CMUST_04345 [Corynebacterium mustelae]AKK07463.1 hypothetical protein CMUST_15875 [Corynebacterium mustelae]